MMLNVQLRAGAPYYRGMYGATAERPRDSNGRVWFNLARNTRLHSRQVRRTASRPWPLAIKVSAHFDRSQLPISPFRSIWARTHPAVGRQPDVVRFLDNNGIIVELPVAS